MDKHEPQPASERVETNNLGVVVYCVVEGVREGRCAVEMVKSLKSTGYSGAIVIIHYGEANYKDVMAASDLGATYKLASWGDGVGEYQQVISALRQHEIERVETIVRCTPSTIWLRNPSEAKGFTASEGAYAIQSTSSSWAADSIAKLRASAVGMKCVSAHILVFRGTAGFTCFMNYSAECLSKGLSPSSHGIDILNDMRLNGRAIVSTLPEWFAFCRGDRYDITNAFLCYPNTLAEMQEFNSITNDATEHFFEKISSWAERRV